MKHTDTHVKVERMLRAAGWLPLRQLEPRKVDVCIKGEHFELWRNAKGDNTLIVHFYGEDNGCQFYDQLSRANTWDATEAALKAIS